jgi:serine/threonine protein kinase
VEGTEFGRYRLQELLGRGGMGEVWRAYDTTARRVVALKVLLASWASDETFQQRFMREAYAAAALTDPHVVPIHNFGEIDGRLYVDMRLVEGRDLDAVLAGGPLDPARAVKIVEQVASALSGAHKVGMVHRDVKPSNILLTDNDFAYLIDFGIAKAADQTRLTGTGGVVGSWAYMAPERFETDADWRADIYALACVLHECLTGARPFQGDGLERQYTAHKFTPPPQPSVVRQGIPAALDTVIAKGMAKDREERYQSAPELAAAAREALTQPVSPPAPPPTPPAHDVATTVPAPIPPVQTPPHVQPARPPVHPTPPRVQPARPPVHPTPPPVHSARPARNTRKLWILAAALVAVLSLAGLVVGWMLMQQHYYVAEYDGKVAIMRGLNQDALLGVSLHKPYMLACVDAQRELSTVPYGSTPPSDCPLLTLKDLNTPGREAMTGGLPGGTLDDAEHQLKQLLSHALLPPCAPIHAQEPQASEPPTTTATASPSPSTTSSPTGSAATPSPPGVDCRAS